MTGSIPEELTQGKDVVSEGATPPTRPTRLSRFLQEAVHELQRASVLNGAKEERDSHSPLQAVQSRSQSEELQQDEDKDQADDMDVLAGLHAVGGEMAPPVFELD